MPSNNNFPPASPDNSDDAVAERQRQNKELLESVGDPAIDSAVRVVNGTANGDLDGDIAANFVGNVSLFVEMAGNHQNELPGDASDEVKGLWQDNPQLRQLCEESARYDSMTDDDKKAFDDKISAYWKVLHGLSDALDQGVTFDEVKLDNATADSDAPEADNAAQEQTPEEVQLKKIEDHEAAVKRYTDLLKTMMGVKAELRSIKDEIANAAPDDDMNAEMQRKTELEANIPRLNEEILKARNEMLSRELLLNAVYGNWGGAPNTAGADNENSQTPEQDTVAALRIKYDNAMAEYAKQKADAETKAKGFGINFKLFGHNISKQSGRDKREPALIEAENSLKASAMNYVKSLVEKKKQNGEYDGTEDEINQKMSDEAFDLMRGLLDNNVRKATNDVLAERQKSRNVLDKGLAWAGRFFNGGGKWSRRFRSGVPGFVAGLGISLSHSAWPVSTLVSIVATGGLRRGSRLAATDENLKRHQDKQGNAKNIISDVVFDTIIRPKERQGLSEDIAHLADRMMEVSREQSYGDSNKASKEARKNVTAFGVGAALGAVAGISYNILSSDVSAAQGPNGNNTNTGGGTNNTPSGDAGKQIGAGLEKTGGGTPPSPPAPDFSGYRYPWDWAAAQFGAENASTELYRLADLASQNGHNVVWHGTGANQWLSIDGISDTEKVLGVLNQYR